MRNSKRACIRVLLNELARSISLKRARLITLAGEGLESELWAELGVKPDHGLLIDQDPQKIQNLSMNPLHSERILCRCRVQDSGPIIDSYWGDGRADFFHLDLYGVIEADYDALPVAVKAVSKSRGKSVAVTFANERQNLADDHSAVVWRILTRVLQYDAQKLIGDLVETNVRANEFLRAGSDPVGQARRELGFILCWCLSHHLAGGISTAELYSSMDSLLLNTDPITMMVPDISSVVRINYNDQSRMKTILLTLNGKNLPLIEALRSLAKHWTLSPLHAIDAMGEAKHFRPSRFDFFF